MGREAYEVNDYSPHNGSEEEKGGAPVYVDEAPAVPGDVFVTGDSTYAKIQRFVSRFGVEPRGIERVPEDERTDDNLMKVGTMVCWASPILLRSSSTIFTPRAMNLTKG